MSIARFYSSNSEQVFFGRVDTPEIRHNGQARITFTQDGKIDFNGIPVQGLVVSSIAEGASHLIVSDSIQLGSGSSGSKPLLYLTGANQDNLVLNVPSSRQINLSVNDVAQAFVNGSGLTVTNGSLFFSGNGANITQSTGSLWYRVPSGSNHSWQINGTPYMTLGIMGLNVNMLSTSQVDVQNPSAAGLIVGPSGTTNLDSRMIIKSQGNAGSYTNLFFQTGSGVGAHTITFGDNTAVTDNSTFKFMHALNNSEVNREILVLNETVISAKRRLVAGSSEESDYNGAGALMTSGGLHVSKNITLLGQLKIGSNNINYIHSSVDAQGVQSDISTGDYRFRVNNIEHLRVSAAATTFNNDIVVADGHYISLPTTGGNNFVFAPLGADMTLELQGAGANIRLRANNTDRFVINGTSTHTVGVPLTIKNGIAGALTLDSDVDRSYLDVPISKSIRLRQGGSTMLDLASGLTNMYGRVVSNDTTDSSSTTTGSNFAGGLSVVKRFYCGGNTGGNANVAIGNIYGSNDITMQMRASDVNNSKTVIHMRSNFIGNPLNGFHIVSEHGDDATGDNRYHGSLYIKQSRIQVAPSTFSAPENRMVFGSQRDIRFSSSGSDTNDFMIISAGIKLKSGLLADFDGCQIKGVVIGPSDQRLKHDINNFDGRDALSILNKVKVKTFRFNDFYRRKNGAIDKLEFGIIAQEIQEIPELRDTVRVLDKKAVFDSTECKEETYKCDITGEMKTRRIPIPEAEIDDLLGVEHSSRLTYLAVSAIQELARQNAYLLEKVRLQKERIDTLESRCSKLEESALLHDELETKVKAIFQKLNMLETNVQASTNIDTFETTSYNESRTARSVLGL